MFKIKLLLPLLLLAGVLLLAGCGTSVDAAPGDTAGDGTIGTTGLAYMAASDGESYICTGIGNATTTDIVIPSVYKGKPVTMIENGAFYNQTALTSVTISEGVRIIGGYAFRGCVRLETVKIPDTVFEIEFRAFEGCTSLKSVEIASGTASAVDTEDKDDTPSEEEMSRTILIGESCFKGCTSLTSFTFPNEEGCILISRRIFDGCTALSEVSIPSYVQAIDEGAFAGCTALRTIRFGGTVEAWTKMPCAPLWNLDVTDCTVVCTDGTSAIGSN